jgi:Peptidase family M48
MSFGILNKFRPYLTKNTLIGAGMASSACISGAIYSAGGWKGVRPISGENIKSEKIKSVDKTDAAKRNTAIVIGIGVGSIARIKAAPIISFLRRIPPVEGSGLETCKKIASEMHIASQVQFLRTRSKEKPLTEYCMGWDSSMVLKPVVFLNSSSSKFAMAHELIHVKEKHNRNTMLYRLSALSIQFATISSFEISSPMLALMLLTATVGNNIISQHQEREADVLACEYIDAADIAAGIDAFSQAISEEEEVKKRILDRFESLKEKYPFPVRSLKYVLGKRSASVKPFPITSCIFSTHPSKRERIKYLGEIYERKIRLHK